MNGRDDTLNFLRCQLLLAAAEPRINMKIDARSSPALREPPFFALQLRIQEAVYSWTSSWFLDADLNETFALFEKPAETVRLKLAVGFRKPVVSSRFRVLLEVSTIFFCYIQGLLHNSIYSPVLY